MRRDLYHLPCCRSLAVMTALCFPATGGAGQALLVVETQEGVASYDIAALEALGPVEVTTTTVWTQGTQHFTGVALDALLADAGIDEGTIVAIAINDYAVEIPVAEARRDSDGYGPVIAYHLNGQPMTVRDKGPLWLVYPYDARSDFQSEVVYTRSIWQLDRIRQSR
ncbi:MAG: molybdopterin-dependent oxidoreductase [Paracoccus sp. (in: a-proteobacteria)]|uniref:molybdopterin-dependent oxidoreductase n=1 Tax=Paracoccus sp. TaxID=267 RepID=UPI00391AF1D6